MSNQRKEEEAYSEKGRRGLCFTNEESVCGEKGRE
jgi:hypothetical protein